MKPYFPGAPGRAFALRAFRKAAVDRKGEHDEEGLNTAKIGISLACRCAPSRLKD
jgi:hypothetical protein